MSYQLFQNYTKNFTPTSKPQKVIGDNQIMNPIIAGLKFNNPFREKDNSARLLSPIKTNELQYHFLNKAYQQEKI